MYEYFHGSTIMSKIFIPKIKMSRIPHQEYLVEAADSVESSC